MPIVMMRDVQGQTFAQRVKQRREELELSQPQAADRANLGVDTWRTVERGYKARKGIGPETGSHRSDRITVRKIARVLGWQPEQALRWAGYDDELPTEPPAGPDPREQLSEILNALTQEQARALFHFVRVMMDTGNDAKGSVYRTEKIETPVELPGQREDNNDTLNQS
jgi:hypothetical protein